MPHPAPHSDESTSQMREWNAWYARQKHGLDARGFLTRDTPCARCGYNLRALQATSRCPECGEPIAASLAGDIFAALDVGALRRMLLGLRCVAGGFAAVCGAWIGFVVLERNVGVGFFRSLTFETIQQILLLALQVLYAFGLWRLVRPPNPDAAPGWWPRYTWLAVWLSGAGVAALAVQVALVVGGTDVRFWGWLLVPNLLAGAVLAWHLAQLFQRAGQTDRARGGRAVAVALAANVTVVPGLVWLMGVIDPPGALGCALIPVLWLLNLAMMASLLFAPCGLLGMLVALHGPAADALRQRTDDA